jgi:DNA-directed RNA polymerase specialized sigma24 family protein
MSSQRFTPVRQRAVDAARCAARGVAQWRSWLDEEDLVQEGLLKVYEVMAAGVHTDKYRESTWNEQFAFLTAVARSACIDYYRRGRRHHLGRVDEEDWHGDAKTPEEATVWSERMSWLRDVVTVSEARLSEREKETLLWWLELGPRPDVAKRTRYTYLERAMAKVRDVARWA